MKTAWITGGKGFIGRNLAKYIASKQCNVFGIGHGFWTQQESEKWSYQAWMNAEIEFANLNHLAVKSGTPDIIYHLAGGSAVGPSIQNPYEDFQRTVDTTARLLEWVRQASPTTKIIGVSSAAVYGAGKSGQIKENSPIHPYSPYGFHKHMLENLFQSYKETYNLNVAVIRLFSVYGAGLEKQLLWDICNKISTSINHKILLNGTGMELRDWLHINDTTKLLWLIGNASNQHEHLYINGGTGIGTNINDVARTVIQHWGEDFNIEFNGVARKGDPESLISNIDLAKSLGFAHEISLNMGIADFVKWFKARQD
jgi:UDP-glucose 4-epimerase